MIDELERVRDFRADEPAPSDATWTTARATLLRTIDGSPRAALGGHARRRTWTGRAAVAALAAAVVVVALGLIGTGSPATPPTAAAAALNRLAMIAASQPPVDPPGPGQYLYYASEARTSVQAPEFGCTMVYPLRREIWIGAQGSGRIRETVTGAGSFSSVADRAACARAGEPSSGDSPGAVNDTLFAPRCLLLGLGSRIHGNYNDPARLLREMRQIDGGPQSPAEDFVHVGDFLRESDASPALRAAIYRAAATIRGVILLGTVHDHKGRRGVGIAYPVPGGYRNELILDQKTSALLGEESISPSGAVQEWTVYLRSGITGSRGADIPSGMNRPCVNGGGYAHDLPSGISIVNGTPVK